MGQAQQKRRAVLIVEDDAELRSLTAALFEDEQVETIECESAEAALATLLIGGREVAMIFADVRLRGVMDGIDLAREVKMRWPLLPVILTSGYPRESGGELPPDVPYMPKPLAAVQSADRRRTGTDIAAIMRLPSLIRAKSLPGSTPQALGHAVARDHALLPSRDGRFGARARQA